MKAKSANLLSRKSGAAIGISARLVGDGTQLALQINFGRRRTLLGTHTIPLKDAYVRAVDKLLEFRGQSDDPIPRAYLIEAYPAFLTRYGLSEEPVQAIALMKDGVRISIRPLADSDPGS